MKGLIKAVLLVAVLVGMASCEKEKSVRGDFHVVPLPQEMTEKGADGFSLTASTTISYPENNSDLERNAHFLASYLQPILGKELAVVTGNGDIRLSLDESIENKEGYRLVATKEGIDITGASPAGVFYGIQTLRKAVPAQTGVSEVLLPSVEINDYPRFAYRGGMLDVCRHFITLDSVKQYIDILALHNINRMHWHLSDDQGWRIEIKKYPRLIEIGSKRAGSQIGRDFNKHDTIPYGGYFTQEQIKEVINYAADRYITIIPEIDMPGHQLSALAAYPDLGCTGGPYEVWKRWGVSEDVMCAGNEKSMRFLEDVLDEVIALFPSEYIHVGGDECPKVRWKECPKCQAKIKELGIKGDSKHSAEEYLQSYVISRMEKFVESKGRHIIGWDEILQGGLAPNATVMSWRGTSGGIEAAKLEHKVIMAPNIYMYFDYYQTDDVENEPLAIGGYVPIEKVYGFEPTDGIPDEYKSYIIGVQANLWTEYISTFDYATYMLLPRMAALAEVQWENPGKKDFNNFISRAIRMTDWYRLLGYNFAKHIFNVRAEFKADETNGTLTAVLTQYGDGDIYYTLDGSEPTTASNKYEQPIVLTEDADLKAVAIRSSEKGRVLSEQIVFNKATLKPVELKSKLHPEYTYEGGSMLTNGLKGSQNFRDGRWIAVCGNDLDVVIDLKEPTEIDKISFDTNVSVSDWIMGVSKFVVKVSDDGKTFKEIHNETIPSVGNDAKPGIYSNEVSFEKQTARFVEIVLTPDVLPEGHVGAGNQAFLFVDEICVK